MFSNDMESKFDAFFICYIQFLKLELILFFRVVGGGNFREFLDDIDTSPSNGGDENVTIDMDHN